jgi:hypothetical protein
MKRIPSALRGPQTLTVESRSRDSGKSASSFVVNLPVSITCAANQALGYYLKEAHLPISHWTVNSLYDSFQIAFPYADTESKVHTVKLKNGQFNAEEFATMVEEALNLITYDPVSDLYTKHTHPVTNSATVYAADTEIIKEIDDWKLNGLPSNRGSDTFVATPSSTVPLVSYVTFKVKYHIGQNRFCIFRTDPGRLYRSGQFDVAFEHHHLAKAFGCPWGGKLQPEAGTVAIDANTGEPEYYRGTIKINDVDTEVDRRFYYNGVRDDTGTWEGNSKGRTFLNEHTQYVITSERWQSSVHQQRGSNVYFASPRPTSEVDPLFGDGGFYAKLKKPKTPSVDWFSHAIQMPYTSRIRQDDCYYVRSSLFGSDSIQTNHSGGGSDCMQMVKIDKTVGEIAFWQPTYSPEPHIITRRDIPSISFTITDKDHQLIDFNGEEILLEIEFITYDLVTIPITLG